MANRLARSFARVCIAVVMAATLTVAVSGTAGAAGAQRIDLRVLVVSNGDLTVEALAAAMDAEGVPYTKVNLADPARPVINADYLADSVGGVARAKFEAVVLPNDNPFGAGSAEMTALADFERTFAVRQVDAFTFPSANVGLTTAGGYAGSLDAMTAQVTDSGKAGAFSYLAGSVPVDDYDAAVSESYGYLAIPAAGAGQIFTPLVDVAVPGTSARGSIIGEFDADGRQQLVMTLVANQYQTYFRALTHGIITWATKGIHLGHSRNYLTVQVDDIFAFDSHWSAANNCTPGEDCPAGVTTTDIRMVPADVTAAVNWQQANNFKFVFAYNGEESVSYIQDHGSDPLTDALLANKDQFSWLNHTYSHEFLSCTKVFLTPTTGTGGVSGDSGGAVRWECLRDAAGNIIWVTKDVIESEINNNIAFARANGITINPTELLTGEHSGLFYLPQVPTDNPNFIDAVNELGIKATGADASRDPVTRMVGGASTFPRHPMALWFNVSSKADEVDEYNWLYNTRADGGSGFCEDNPTIATCIAPLDPATGFESHIVPIETRFDLLGAITNDPRPLYIHQPNLTEDRLIYPVLDSVLSTYHGLFNASAPFVQPSVTDLTKVMVDQKAWKTAQTNVSAYLLNGQVTVESTDGAVHDVPVTVPTGTTVNGAPFGDAYAGERSAWTPVGTTPVVATVPVAWDARLASTTTVTTSLNPAAAGQLVTFTATVAPTAPANGTPTGTIQFRLGGAAFGNPVVLDGSGTATLATVSLPAGSHTIDALYNGDNAFTGSVSNAVTQQIDALAVTSSTPSTLSQGTANQLVTITGTGFLYPPSLVVSGTGVVVNFVSWNSSTQLTASLTVDAAAELGPRDLTVTNPDGGAVTLTGGLTVAVPVLAVTSVSPSSLTQGSTTPVTISGSGFDAGATVVVSGTGVTVGSVVVNSATQLTANVTVTATAPVGARDLTVTNSGGATTTLAAGLAVATPSVSVTSVSPNNLARGALNRAVTITGTGFAAGATVAFSGDGISVGSVTVTSPTQLTAIVTVASTATPGTRDVTVTLPGGGTGTLANAFTVNGPPVVSSVSPNSVGEGSTVAMTVSGSNFVNGAKVTVSGTGVTVGPVTWNSSTSLTANITVAPTASATARTVSVTNPDTRTGSCSGCLTVTGVPVVLSISPTALQAGASNQVVRITGSGFTSALFGTGSGATASFGADVTVLSLARNSDTQLTARVTVAATAAPGARDVQVTGRGGLSSVLAGGFTVSPRPTITSLSPTSLRRTGLAQTLTITGTGFASGARATFTGGGISVNSTTVNGQTSITVVLTISRSAALGARTVTVTNSNGSATTPATFQVTA